MADELEGAQVRRAVKQCEASLAQTEAVERAELVKLLHGLTDQIQWQRRGASGKKSASAVEELETQVCMNAILPTSVCQL